VSNSILDDTFSMTLCVTYGKWCQHSLWRQLDLSSCEFHS